MNSVFVVGQKWKSPDTGNVREITSTIRQSLVYTIRYADGRVSENVILSRRAFADIVKRDGLVEVQ